MSQELTDELAFWREAHETAHTKGAALVAWGVYAGLRIAKDGSLDDAHKEMAMAQCLSCLGPPPHCGHQPTPEQPICANCESSYRNYVRLSEERAIRDAKRLLESCGYIVRQS